MCSAPISPWRSHPSFTPDPRARPFDRRWASEIAAVGFKDQEPPQRVSDDFIVLFDPRNADAAHVAELRRRYRVQEIALPFAGHDLATTLARMGLLGSIVRHLIDGAEAEVDSLRRVQMLRQASDIAPGAAHVQLRLGEALMEH